MSPQEQHILYRVHFLYASTSCVYVHWHLYNMHSVSHTLLPPIHTSQQQHLRVWGACSHCWRATYYFSIKALQQSHLQAQTQKNPLGANYRINNRKWRILQWRVPRHCLPQLCVYSLCTIPIFHQRYPPLLRGCTSSLEYCFNWSYFSINMYIRTYMCIFLFLYDVF